MIAILNILKGILSALPLVDKLINLLKKSPQEKVDQSVEDLRKELDEFKKTGRPNA